MMSGAMLDRPGLSRLRELMRAKTIDTVIVYSSDRLTRSIAHAMLLRDEMKNAGAAVHTVAHRLSQDSPEGGLMETIEATFAEYERSKIAERMQRGQRQRIISKHSHGNKLPFGYCYADNERMQIVIHEEEAAVVRMIFNWYLTEPIGSMQIAIRLTELRLPSPADRKQYFAVVKKRARGEWSQSSVTAIIKQPAYKGELHYKYSGEEFIIRVTPIITQGEWDQATYLREERLRLSRRAARQLYILRTHVRCGRCGSSCVGSHGGRRFHYYRCVAITKPKADRTKCNLPQFRDVILEGSVWSWLCSDVLNEEHIRAAIAPVDDETEGKRAHLEGERATLARQLESLDARASKLIELYTIGGFSLTDIAAQKAHVDLACASCRKALIELDERLTGMATAKQRADELCQLVQTVREGLPDLPNEERYRIINLLDLQITLDFEGEAGRGKHPSLYADVVCNLTLDSVRLWALGYQDAESNKTTIPSAPS